MTQIGVKVGPAATAGALEPRYDEEAAILAAESPVASEWVFGVDIDGRMVFDLAADRTLANVDLHIGRSRWIADEGIQWPRSMQEGVIVFDEDAIATKSFHLPIRVSFDPREELVHVAIGDVSGDNRSVCLAERCVALVDGGSLAGFLFRLT